MADLLPVIETLEHRWMRAWVGRDARAFKTLMSREFRFVTGSQPCVILDAKSWVEAATARYFCTSYRFGDVYVHDLGGAAVFASQLTLEAKLDGADWSGQVWVTDVWRKSRVRRRWRLADRGFSRLEERPEVPAAIRSLQLWR